MKNLWAPWRMNYILSEDRSKDGERLILYVGSLTVAMMNRFPYNNGHLLVAPLRHVAQMEDLSDEETLDLLRIVRESIGILRKVMQPEGFNVGMNLGRIAGAGMEEHMHFHIVPRWSGDTNFMTVLGEVRVIPEHIKETHRKLKPFFEKIK
ncbi:MAG: HIT domain-containing protein [Deltaproteobacteria bacterium]|nr:HIT domain-containing protein [Deltaproteobacteria bacterium]